ncbi:hypothetical protein MAQA_05308 [Listeria aquatica FSL S10-1188]|uniref:Uncharacterized protein n=1 Tax=Listeria aquatica FSL S10-1188 TaxID=1265818 RepID=W7B129_9LIST|nr:hypothetical protein MAQA_05308 [Listeria aquatica FSL S10-1188]
MVKLEYAKELVHEAFPAPLIESDSLDVDSIFVSGVPFWQEQLFYQENGGVRPWEFDRAKACRKLGKQMTALLENLDAVLRAHEKPDPAIVRDAQGLFFICFILEQRAACQAGPVRASGIRVRIKAPKLLRQTYVLLRTREYLPWLSRIK